MTALHAAMLQAFAWSLIGGVSLAWLAYATGLDRAVRFVIWHPLKSAEITLAVIISQFPSPKPKRKARHAR